MTTAHSNDPTRRDSPYSTGGIAEAEIDQSTRTPVLFFFSTALLWLLLSTLLSLVTAMKLHWPGFLDGVEFLTYGRFRAAAVNSFVYGWAGLSIIAVGFWLLARLSQSKLPNSPVLLVAGVFWNIGLLIGIGGIFLGDLRGHFLLELPRYSVPILMIAYALVGVWGVMAFYSRRLRVTFVSQWFLVGAFFWFPWIYSIAQVMLFGAPVRGTLQSVVAAWYAYNVYALWLAPVALAAIYYLLPKLIGRPIPHYYLASVGFWSYALFAGFGGVAKLSGGPVPAWISTAGIISLAMLLAPVAIFAVHYFGTLSGQYQKVGKSPTLRFLLVGIVAFMAAQVLMSLLAFRGFQEVVQFTHVQTAFWMLCVYGFFSMVIFATAYFMMPRLLGTVWPSPTLVKTHFWSALIGIGLIVGGLGLGGWIQGARLLDPDIAFLDIARGTLPWLVTASFGWLILLIGHVALFLNFALMACCACLTSPASGRESLFANPPEMKVRTT